MRVFKLIKTTLTKTDCYLVTGMFFLAHELMLFVSDMFEICLTAYRPTLLQRFKYQQSFFGTFWQMIIKKNDT